MLGKDVSQVLTYCATSLYHAVYCSARFDKCYGHAVHSVRVCQVKDVSGHSMLKSGNSGHPVVPRLLHNPAADL